MVIPIILSLDTPWSYEAKGAADEAARAATKVDLLARRNERGEVEVT